MLRIVWRAAFVCLAVGSVCVGAAVVGGLLPRDLAADESQRVRLLVKCDQGELTNVLAALAKTKAEVWDLGTMKPLTPQPSKAPPAPSPAAKEAVRGPIAPLRDAGRAMTEILASVSGIKPTPRVTEMAIQPRAAMLTLTAASDADVDRVVKALEANAWLGQRLDRVGRGSTQRSRGQVQSKLYVKFDTTHPEPGTAVYLDKLDMQVIERVVHAQKMQYVFAGPIGVDPNRKAGHVTTYREFTFQTTQLAPLINLTRSLSQSLPGLVVYEIRWKDNGHGHLLKPIVRVGGRAPLKP